MALHMLSVYYWLEEQKHFRRLSKRLHVLFFLLICGQKRTHSLLAAPGFRTALYVCVRARARVYVWS